MVEDIMQQGADPSGSGSVRPPTPAAMCSTAAMCKRMMDKPPSGLLLMLPGAVLIAVGVLIFVEPAILVWLVIAGTVLLGIALLMMAYFIRRPGAHLRGKSVRMCCGRPSNGEP